jgi:hypothetical protein
MPACFMLSPPEAWRVFRAFATAWFVAQTSALNIVPPLCASDSIVFICQRDADKISGGRSPNDQAFESLR